MRIFDVVLVVLAIALLTVGVITWPEVHPVVLLSMLVVGIALTWESDRSGATAPVAAGR